MTEALLTLALVAPSGHPVITVCYNYGCAQHVRVPLEETTLARAARLFADTDSPETERLAISLVAGLVNKAASAYVPIAADQGRNPWTESGVDGRMDCIDHSMNTASLLAALHGRGWLRYHVPGPRVRRNKLFVLAPHWTATIQENATGAQYAVDTWFRGNGHPAVVMPLEVWKRGGGPDE